MPDPWLSRCGPIWSRDLKFSPTEAFISFTNDRTVLVVQLTGECHLRCNQEIERIEVVLADLREHSVRPSQVVCHIASVWRELQTADPHGAGVVARGKGSLGECSRGTTALRTYSNNRAQHPADVMNKVLEVK